MASSDPRPATDRRLLLLAAEDNVLAACGDLAAGTEVVIDGAQVTLAEAVPVGFKLARRDLGVGEKVVKYGAPIGSMTAPARRGAIVHTHNLQSDYLPTYTLTGERRFVEG